MISHQVTFFYIFTQDWSLAPDEAKRKEKKN
jgi:hypothetical protein